MKLITKVDNVIEIVLDDKEISELEDKLNKLKKNKSHIHFDIDKDNHLLIHHNDDEFL